jgi:hypothetical protein
MRYRCLTTQSVSIKLSVYKEASIHSIGPYLHTSWHQYTYSKSRHLQTFCCIFSLIITLYIIFSVYMYIYGNLDQDMMHQMNESYETGSKITLETCLSIIYDGQ